MPSKKVKLYSYPKCSTCRKAIQFLDKRDVSYQLVDIVESPPSATELKKALKGVDGEVKKLFNTSGQLYREMGIKDKLAGFSQAQAIELLSKHGKLIKRPLLIQGADSLVGFREAQWKESL